jgi:tetraacyldisaccharide 4'-kinase
MRAPEFWGRNDALSRAIVALLTPIGWLYGASVRWKMSRAEPMRPRARVICVGNLTVGGTGKTPVTGYIAQMLAEKGLKVFVLSRGYGGRVRHATLVDPEQDAAADVGDEPLILSQTVPVIVSADRRKGAALAEKHKADVIVMDDGHQNFALVKDLSLVVVDAESGFANGRVLPAGPLREPVAQGLARADAVVLVGDGTPSLDGFAGPVLRARIVTRDAPELRGTRVVAFAGIGRPDKFFQSLRSLGAELAHANPYPDHHVYTASEVARLRAKARVAQAELITTEKDFVRLTPIEREGILVLPVEAAFEDPPALSDLLDRARANAVAPSPDERRA